jgi:microcystin-dependent protein
LPNLQGRVPLHMSNSYPLGEVAGVAQVTLNVTQVGHSHAVAANTTANAFTAAGNFPAAAPAGNNIYGPTVDTAMNANTVTPGGGSQPHSNLQPYLVVNYVIALRGIFPSRN